MEEARSSVQKQIHAHRITCTGDYRHRELAALVITVDDDDNNGRVPVLVGLPYNDQCLVKYVHKLMRTE